MSFTVTEMEVRDRHEIWRDTLQLTFETRLQAWEAAYDCAMARGLEWQLTGGLDCITVLSGKSEFRFYVHDAGQALPRVSG